MNCTLSTLLPVSVFLNVDHPWTVPSAPCYLYLCLGALTPPPPPPPPRHELYPQHPVTCGCEPWTPLNCTLSTLLSVSVSVKLDIQWTVSTAPCYLYLCLGNLTPHELYPQHPVTCICVWEAWSPMNCIHSTLLSASVSGKLDPPWTVPAAPCYLYLCLVNSTHMNRTLSILLPASVSVTIDLHERYPQHHVTCICICEPWSPMNCTFSTPLPVPLCVCVCEPWSLFISCQWRLPSNFVAQLLPGSSICYRRWKTLSSSHALCNWLHALMNNWSPSSELLRFLYVLSQILITAASYISWNQHWGRFL